jgi:hypothetical protein
MAVNCCTKFCPTFTVSGVTTAEISVRLTGKEPGSALLFVDVAVMVIGHGEGLHGRLAGAV